MNSFYCFKRVYSVCVCFFGGRGSVFLKGSDFSGFERCEFGIFCMIPRSLSLFQSIYRTSYT